MKVIYYSHNFFTDADFPLIKALRDHHIDVSYYVPLPLRFRQCVLFRLNKPILRLGIVKASEMPELQIYKDFIDLEKLYFIMGYHRFFPLYWIIWLRVLWMMKKEKADVVHITWIFSNIYERFLFKFRLGKMNVMTIHDPFSHSGLKKKNREETQRLRTFKWADRFVILNNKFIDSFSDYYNIPHDNIYISKLGPIDELKYITPTPTSIEGDYILFFGFISPYKGLEYLLEAMNVVKRQHPNLKVVIAGGGAFYFDASPYQSEQFVWLHRFVGISELVSLLNKSKFVVCPYKDATQSGVVQMAFTMGVPVLASDVGALSETIENNVTGLFVPPCDPIALAEKICFLYSNENILNQMRGNINTSWREKQNWDDIVNDYLKVYNSCVG